MERMFGWSNIWKMCIGLYFIVQLPSGIILSIRVISLRDRLWRYLASCNSLLEYWLKNGILNCLEE